MAAATATKTASVQEPAAAAKLQVASVSEPQYARFFAGGLASATAEIFTLPIDCTKVRLQAQRAVSIPMMTNVGMVTARQEVQYNGMLNAVQTIVKEEGPGALWKGATPALLRQVSYTSICMVLYEPLRDLFGANQANKSDVPFVNRFLAGGFAGAIGISIANPYVLHALLLVSCIAALIARQIVPLDGREYLILHVLHCNSVDVIKVRMQADRTGTLYRGVGDAVSKIYQREGFRGFLRGMPPNIQRGFIVNAAELGTYDHSKEWLITSGLLRDGVFAHTGASCVAGFAGAAASNPIDVIKTRLMSQPTDARGKGSLYAGMADCAKQTFQEGGVQAFYKGFIPNWMRKAPWCVIFFVTYEKYRATLLPQELESSF